MSVAATLLIVGLCVLVGMSLTRVIAPRIERVTAVLEKLAVKGPDGAGCGYRRATKLGGWAMR